MGESYLQMCSGKYDLWEIGRIFRTKNDFYFYNSKSEESAPVSSAAVAPGIPAAAASVPDIPVPVPSAPVAPAVASAPESEPSAVAPVIENDAGIAPSTDEQVQPVAPSVVQEQSMEVITNSVEETPKQESLE